MVAGQYVVEIVKGEGLDLRSGKIRPTVQAVIKFTGDDMIAAKGSLYYADRVPRNINALAGKLRQRWRQQPQRPCSRR